MKAEYELDKDLLILIQEWTPYPFIETFHWHRLLEIGCCISGKGRFYFGDKTYDVRPGDVFVVNNLERHIAQSDPSDPSVYYFVYFDPVLIDRAERELLMPFVYQPKLFDNKIPAAQPAAAKIGQLVSTLWQEQQERGPAYRSMMQSVLLQICTELLRHYGYASGMSDYANVFNLYDKLQPAMNYMKENFREPIGLADVAEQLNLSASRTRHLFKETIGEGVKEHLMHLRINEAKRLLSSTDFTVTEICLRCGFQSHTPFYRAFGQLVGMTPQQYRDQASVLSVLTKDGGMA